MNRNYDYYLWADFKKGRRNALDIIFTKYVDVLHGLGKKFSYTDEFIKESIQDLFTHLITNRNVLGSTDNILFILVKVYRNKILKPYTEAGNRQFFRSFTDDLETISSITEDNNSLKDWFKLEHMDKDEHHKNINSLRNEIFFYRLLCCFEYKQIGDILSIPSDLVQNTLIKTTKVISESVNALELIEG